MMPGDARGGVLLEDSGVKQFSGGRVQLDGMPSDAPGVAAYVYVGYRMM